MGTPFESVDIQSAAGWQGSPMRTLHLHACTRSICRFDVVGVTWSTAGGAPHIRHLR